MTIYALSSGPGVSGIAVIRISGSKVEEIVKLITNDQLPEPRQATLKKFNKINNSELIDEGILIWFPGPESYTGEDMAEIHVHGSIAVVRSILDQLSKFEDFFGKRIIFSQKIKRNSQNSRKKLKTQGKNSTSGRTCPLPPSQVVLKKKAWLN